MNTDEYKLFISDCKKVISKSNKELDITYDLDNITQSVFKNYNKARQKAANIRQKYINNIDEYLVLFEKKFIENSGIVNWSVNYDIVIDQIVKILRENKVKEVNLFESQFIQELGIGRVLKDEEIKVISQDNKCVIFEPKYGVTQTGSLFLLFNSAFEMELVLSAEIKIFILSINNIVKKLEDIELLSNLYSINKNKQDFPYLSSIYTPQKDNKNKNIQVFLVDNARSNILESKEHRKALTCIECDACKKVCPVFNLIGEMPYNNVFSGPIANVILPFLETIDGCMHLSFNCVLCGNCSKVCPMNIPVSDLIINNRNIFYDRKYMPISDRYKVKLLRKFYISRKKLNQKHNIKNFILKYYVAKKNKKSRIIPRFSKFTFEQINSGNAKY